MDKQELSNLLSDLEQELLRLGYTEGTMKFYRRRWQQLTEFAQNRGELYYTEQLGIDFVLEQFGIIQDDFGRALPQSQLKNYESFEWWETSRCIVQSYEDTINIRRF